MRALIPSLTIQPLLENAIYHGIELLPDGGEVKVSGRRVDDDLRIIIRNPVAPNHARKKGGNKMAMANIRQRFELAYGNKASVDVEETDGIYNVKLQFPCEEGAL
jgi:two-component system sensor histidine kinase AlgZ